MARTDIARTDISRAGVNPAGTAGQVDGHMFTNTGKEFVEVSNADASARTVTFVTPRTVEGLAITDLALSVPAGGRLIVGPFPPETFSQPRSVGADAGKVYINYVSGSETQFTTRVYRLP
jgi:hypothetical protein